MRLCVVCVGTCWLCPVVVLMVATAAAAQEESGEGEGDIEIPDAQGSYLAEANPTLSESASAGSLLTSPDISGYGSIMPPPSAAPYASFFSPHRNTNTNTNANANATTTASELAATAFLETLTTTQTQPQAPQRQSSISSLEVSPPPAVGSDPRLIKRRKLSHKISAEAMEDEIFGNVGGGGLGVDEDGVGAMLGD